MLKTLKTIIDIMIFEPECKIDSPLLFSEVLVEVIMDSEDSCVGYQSLIANANAM